MEQQHIHEVQDAPISDSRQRRGIIGRLAVAAMTAFMLTAPSAAVEANAESLNVTPVSQQYDNLQQEPPNDDGDGVGIDSLIELGDEHNHPEWIPPADLSRGASVALPEVPIAPAAPVAPAAPAPIGALNLQQFNTFETDRTITPRALILHWQGGRPNNRIEGLANVLHDRGLSVQYGENEDGTVFQMTPQPNSFAEHAKCGNTYGIGIEISGPPINDVQIEATALWISAMMDQFPTIPEGVHVAAGNELHGITDHEAVDKLCSNRSGKVDIDDATFDRIVARVAELRGWNGQTPAAPAAPAPAPAPIEEPASTEPVPEIPVSSQPDTLLNLASIISISESAGGPGASLSDLVAQPDLPEQSTFLNALLSVDTGEVPGFVPVSPPAETAIPPIELAPAPAPAPAPEVAPGQFDVEAAIARFNTANIPAEFVPYFIESARRHGFDPAYLAAQAYQESRFDPRAVSSSNARGLTQFVPGTWRAHGVDGNGNGTIEPFEPADAIASQGIYLAIIRDGLIAAGVEPKLENILSSYVDGPRITAELGRVPQGAECEPYISKNCQSQHYIDNINNFALEMFTLPQ